MTIQIFRPYIVPRALAASGVISTIVWEYWFRGLRFGYSAYENNTARYVAAGTSPFALIFSVLGIALLFVLMRTEIRVGEFQISSLWRRYAAFAIDFWFSIFVFANITAVIPLLLEARRSHSFQWQFDRDYFVSSDWILGVFVLMGMAWMLAYFVLPLANRRQTVGFWILRIATVTSGGNVFYLPLSTAILCKYLEFVELCSPWKIMKSRDAEGRSSYDRESGFMVVHF